MQYLLPGCVQVTRPTLKFSAVSNISTSFTPKIFEERCVAGIGKNPHFVHFFLEERSSNHCINFSILKARVAAFRLFIAYWPPISVKVPGFIATSSSQQLKILTCFGLILLNSLMLEKLKFISAMLFL